MVPRSDAVADGRWIMASGPSLAIIGPGTKSEAAQDRPASASLLTRGPESFKIVARAKDRSVLEPAWEKRNG
jgi:hypothetical protein